VDRVYCVYILTNQRNKVLYTGVAARSERGRISTGRSCCPGYEPLQRSRQKKIDLINGFNPEWRDLYDDL
jgi:predicted GIY-YIG superfamily endonuclease